MLTVVIVAADEKKLFVYEKVQEVPKQTEKTQELNN